MLLEFKTSNYKSFVDEMFFSMIPAPHIKNLKYSIQYEKVKDCEKEYKALSSAVIYGPNASGKTNIIGAMDTMKAIILRGNINNSDVLYSPYFASAILEFIPNCKKNGKSTLFFIKFIEKELLIEYSFEIDLGNFMERDYQRKILKESLSINEQWIFKRNSNDVEINFPQSIEPYINLNKTDVKNEVEIAKKSLNEKELFLNNGFKTIISKDLVSLILGWFNEKFIVFIRTDILKIQREFVKPPADAIYVEKTLSNAAKIFGVNSNELGYRFRSDNNKPVLCSIIEKGSNKKSKIIVPAESFESYGTLRFINEFPLIVKALSDGVTLVVDEFDASIHPMALMNIVNIFHNDEINKKHAQLIFNTHNPIFLNAGLFRRDEIKFVERDENDNSTHYSLSDFAVTKRNRNNYMHNYFMNRYGAIKNVDFSQIFERQ